MADGILLKCKCLFIGSGAWITFWKRAVITGCDWVRLAVCSKRGTREADTAYLTALNSCLLHTNPSQLARICILQDTSISAITAFLKEAPRSLHKSHSLSLFPVLKVKVLVAQLCLTFCNSMDCSPLGSSVMGFSRQAFLGDELRSFCHFWDCTQVLHFRFFFWLWGLLHLFREPWTSRCSSWF